MKARAYDELTHLAADLRDIGWRESAADDLHEMAMLIMHTAVYFEAAPGTNEYAIAEALMAIGQAAWSVADNIAAKDFEAYAQAAGSAGADQSKPH